MNSELQVQAHYLAEYTAGYKTSHFTFIRPLGIMPAVANFFFFLFHRLGLFESLSFGA